MLQFFFAIGLMPRALGDDPGNRAFVIFLIRGDGGRHDFFGHHRFAGVPVQADSGNAAYT